MRTPQPKEPRTPPLPVGSAAAESASAGRRSSEDGSAGGGERRGRAGRAHTQSVRIASDLRSRLAGGVSITTAFGDATATGALGIIIDEAISGEDGASLSASESAEKDEAGSETRIWDKSEGNVKNEDMGELAGTGNNEKKSRCALPDLPGRIASTAVAKADIKSEKLSSDRRSSATDDDDKAGEGPSAASRRPFSVEHLLGSVAATTRRATAAASPASLRGRLRRLPGRADNSVVLDDFRRRYASLLEDAASPGFRDDFPSAGTSDDVRGILLAPPRTPSPHRRGSIDVGSEFAEASLGGSAEDGVGDDHASPKNGTDEGCDEGGGGEKGVPHGPATVVAVDHNDGMIHAPDDADVRNHRRVHASRRAASKRNADGVDVVPVTYRNGPSSLGLRRRSRQWPPRGGDAPAELDGCRSPRADDLSSCSESAKSVSSGGGRRRRRRPKASSPHDSSLAAAWRVLSATPSPDKEGDWSGTAVAVRDDDAVAALAVARSIEARVVDSIRKMGEMVIAARKNSEPSSLRSVHGAAYDDHSGSDDVWDYFCDRDIVGLLVDMVASEPPPPGGTFSDPSQSPPMSMEQLHKPHCVGPAWTAAVKSQVLCTVTSLLSSMADDDVALFYLLSNHRVNDLLLSLLPLRRWTEEALEEMAPALCGLLRALALRLREGPHLLQFLLDERSPQGRGPSDSSFPLLRAAVEVASSPRSQSDAYVRQTALHVVLDVCRVPSGAVRDAVGESSSDQRALLSHLCRRLVGRYGRIAQLTAGPAAGGGSGGGSNSEKIETLRAELADLRNQLRYIDDLLWCGVRAMNVRACELLLRSVLFRHVLPGMLMHRCVGGRRPRAAGPSLAETPRASPWDESAVRAPGEISEAEAMAQASVVFLGQAFLTLEYAPLLKMIAVAALHPLSPAGDWDRMEENDGEYALTQALNAVAQGRTISPEDRDLVGNVNSELEELEPQQPSPQDASSWQEKGGSSDDSEKGGEHRVEAVINLYRQSLLSLIRGDLGDRRFVPAAVLLQCLLDLEDFDHDVLQVLGVLPNFSDATNKGHVLASPSSSAVDSGTDGVPCLRESTDLVKSPFEDALAVFFNRRNRMPSSSSTLAIDCGVSLALSFASHLAESMTDKGTDFDSFHERFRNSPLIAGIAAAKIMHTSEAKRFREASDLAEAIVDLFELEIGRRYCVVERGGEYGSRRRAVTCPLRAAGATPAALRDDPESLLGVRSARDAASNDVESACFAIRHALQFRAVCAALAEARNALGSVLGPHSLGSRWGRDHYTIRAVEEADREVMAVGGFTEARPPVGTDLDVRGRTFFYFSPPTGAMTGRSSHVQQEKHRGLFGRNRKLAEDMILRATAQRQTELMIVLDPNELFVLQPNAKSEGVKAGGNRGKILCSASLRSVITAVSDKEWLHIAIRHMENVDSLIKNGNMSLRFDSPGTCLIVRQYLERCRSALRCKLSKQIDILLDGCLEDPFSAGRDETLAETIQFH